MNHASNERFLALFQQSALPIQIYNLQGKTVAVNDAWETLFATKKSELDNYNVLEDPQVHQNGVIHCFRRAFAGEVVSVPATYYDPALSGKVGRARWLESVFSPVKNDQGKVIEVATIFKDVTDLKIAQEELSASSDQLKIIFENVAEGVLVQDANNKCIFANHEAARMAGFPSPEEWMKGTALVSHHVYLTEDGQPFPMDELPSRLAFAGMLNPPETNIRFLNKRTGIEKVSAVITRPVLNKEGKPYLAVSVFRDITEQIEREKAQMRALEERRSALDAKDLFFSVASHELRTPLTSLKLQLQILNDEVPEANQVILKKVDRQINKLAQLVEDMLDISRISLGKLELRRAPTNLTELVKEVFERLRLHLELAEIQHTLSCDEDVLGLWDPDRVEQIIENLVTNAMKYAKSPITVKVSKEGHEAVLEIRDFGPGIPEEDWDRIFERFERSGTAKDYSGFGLGLYIVREIVQLHGGSIHVSSPSSGGASFIVKLPLPDSESKK